MARLTRDTSRFLARHPVFRLEEFRAACGAGRSDQTVRARVKQFVASGRLRLLSRGVYAVTPPGEEAEAFTPDPLLVASRLARDSVLAYHSAFEALGYAHQVFSEATYVTAGHRRTVRLGEQTFRALAPCRRLGEEWDRLAVETVYRQGMDVKTTSRERALAESLDRPGYSGGFEELLACMASVPSLDFALLERYLLARGSPTLFARVGFVLDRFAQQLSFDEHWRGRLARHTPRSAAYLLRREAGCVLVHPWQLLVPPSVAEVEESPLR
jgi:predicted transcriptional regulator of viral defense system